MIVKATVVMKSLKRHSRWIERLPISKWRDEATENRVEDIVVGCFDLMEYSPTTDLAGWLAHRPRRKQLRDPTKAVWNDQGRKAILELITLTISELDACLPFQPTVVAGVLPVTAPRRLTPDHVQALHQGRDRYHDRTSGRDLSRRKTADLAHWKTKRPIYRPVF